MKNKLALQQRVLALSIVISMIPVFFAAKKMFTAFAQTKSKSEKIIKKVSFENEPIEFVGLESDEKEIKQDEKFVREDDWLKDFTIKFKNISDKPITFISIVLLFPETGPNGQPMSYALNYGSRQSSKNSNKTDILSPNNTAEVKLSVENHTGLKNFLSSRSLLSDITEVNFRIMTVHFADGTHWTAGTYWTPDPNRAGKFIPTDNESQEANK